MDFRSQLYDRYVTTFKEENASLTADELEHYFEWRDARYYPYLKQLPRSASILELGCGHGRILSYLHHKGLTNVKGIDISEEQITLAARDGLDAECADVFEYLEQLRTPVDCIIAIDFIEHFTKSEALRLMELVRSAMNPGATLLLQTPNAEGLFARQVMYGDLTHETIYSPGSLAQLLRTSGFKNIRSFECAPIANGIYGIERVLAWRLIRSVANLIRRIESNKRQAIWTENFICVAEV